MFEDSRRDGKVLCDLGVDGAPGGTLYASMRRQTQQISVLKGAIKFPSNVCAINLNVI